jgi:hypothetical protein
MTVVRCPDPHHSDTLERKNVGSRVPEEAAYVGQDLRDKSDLQVLANVQEQLHRQLRQLPARTYCHDLRMTSIHGL